MSDKVYYHISVGLHCGVCGWAMLPDADNYATLPPVGELASPKWSCKNPDCPQRDKVFIRKPLEADVVSERTRNQTQQD